MFKGGGGIKRGVRFVRLLKNDSGELDRASVLTGHFPLGMREYLPSHLPEERELRFFTFLREPTDRTLSHYYAIRESGGGYALPPLPAEATLEDALAGGYLHDNLQTRMLSGLPEPFGEVDDEMLAQAKHNLRDGLACFGLTERFDESLVLAKQRLGLRSILYGSSARVNAKRPRGDDVPAELRHAAERCNRHDIELYRYAEQLFDAAPERNQPDFEIELAALHAAQADGEIELDAPPPDNYSGDHHSWRMLLHARATTMRSELERAELRALVYESAQRDQEVLRALELIHAAGKTTPGRDAETAMRAIQLLVGRRQSAGPKRQLRDARRSRKPSESADG